MHYKIFSATPPGEHSARPHLRLTREQRLHQSATDTSPIDAPPLYGSPVLTSTDTTSKAHYDSSQPMHHTCPSHVKLPPGTTACGTRSLHAIAHRLQKKKKMLLTMMRMGKKGLWLRHNSPTPPFSPTCFTLSD